LTDDVSAYILVVYTKAGGIDGKNKDIQVGELTSRQVAEGIST
jgi:hypothetical protein